MNRRGRLVFALLCAWHALGNAQECAVDASAAHAPITVLYGPSGAASQATILAPSSDGTVRALDARTGESLWEFSPPEAAAAPGTADSITDIRVLRFDANGDGTIDASNGDKVWLYFGLRQAGPYYYALDITERTAPRVLWERGADVLDGLGDAWSTPTLARVRIAGATQNGEHFVLIFGGGYVSRAGSGSGAVGAAGAAVGNRIFMVDAATGRLLWYAGGGGGARAPDLVLTAMTQPVPARIAVLDTDGDEFADRMYAVDVSGRVWRFDVWNGHSRDTLVTGGVLADLSGGGRAFFNAPDVALIQPRGGEPYENVAVGSGDPRTVTASAAQDFFYSVRDKEPFTRRTQASYDGAIPILPDALIDVAASPGGPGVPSDGAGWKIALDSNGGGGVIGESLTVNGVVMFTTFQPSTSAGACEVAGSSRVYAVRVDPGTAALDFDDDGKITVADLSMPLPTTGVPGEIHVEPGGVSAQSSADASGGPSGGTAGGGSGASGGGAGVTSDATAARCLVGSYVLAKCVSVGALVRTYWQRPSVN